jgi:hypothetical protein
VRARVLLLRGGARPILEGRQFDAEEGVGVLDRLSHAARNMLLAEHKAYRPPWNVQLGN